MKRYCRTGLTAILAVACHPAAPAPALPVMSSTASAACLDSVLAAAKDSVDATVYAFVDRSDSVNAERRAFDGVALQTVAQQIRIEGVVSLPTPSTFEATRVEQTTLMLPPVRSRLSFLLHSDGGISDLQRTSMPKTAQLDFALFAALEHLRDTKALGPVPAYLGDAPLRFIMAIGWTKPEKGDAVALLMHRFPKVIAVDAKLVPGSGRPIFPRDGMVPGVRDTVRAEFDVDERGAVDTSSVVIAEAHYTVFARNTRDAILKARFTPAAVAGCPVRQHVVEPYMYEVENRIR